MRCMRTKDMSVGFDITNLNEETVVEFFGEKILVKDGLARFQPSMNFSNLFVVNHHTLAGWSYGYHKTYYTIEIGCSNNSLDIGTLSNRVVESKERRESAYVDGELSENKFEAAVVLSEVQ